MGLPSRIPRAALLFLLSLVRNAFASNGPAISTGPVDDGNFIREAVSTLIVPEAPSPIVGNTVLWVGMGTSNGDLIQGINNNYPPDTLYVAYDPSGPAPRRLEFANELEKRSLFQS